MIYRLGHQRSIIQESPHKGSSMDLILWRHAEAEPGTPDSARKLTTKGHRQAKSMSTWLTQYLPDDVVILVSPALRCTQTADALARKYQISNALALDGDPENILTTIGWPKSAKPVLIVGHQPTLGEIAALCLSGTAADWQIKKGAVWWLAQQGEDVHQRATLIAAMEPALLRGKVKTRDAVARL